MTIAEKRRITEIAIFGGYGGKKAVDGDDLYFICLLSQ